MALKITILCSSARHPINSYLYQWVDANRSRNDVSLVRRKDHLLGGDILFLISCDEILEPSYLELYRKTLVLHASDLPEGRGWSPHIWQIVGGANEITMTLLEAADKVDAGCIWKKLKVPISEDALWDEINHAVFTAELQLMDFAVTSFHTIRPVPQSEEVVPTYYPRRTPEDSMLDPMKSLFEQFNLMRVCDPERFPAYFELYGNKYLVKLEKKS